MASIKRVILCKKEKRYTILKKANDISKKITTQIGKFESILQWYTKQTKRFANRMPNKTICCGKTATKKYETLQNPEQKCNFVKFAKDFSIKKDNVTKWKDYFGFIWHDWEVHEHIVDVKQKLQNIKWQLEQLYQDTKQQKKQCTSRKRTAGRRTDGMCVIRKSQLKEKYTLILQSMLFYWKYNANILFL